MLPAVSRGRNRRMRNSTMSRRALLRAAGAATIVAACAPVPTQPGATQTGTTATTKPAGATGTLTAEAVAFSFDRSINKDNPLFKEAQAAGGFPFIDDYIGNVVAKVEAVGALDVRFTLRRKFSPLVPNLAIPPGFVISMEALKKYGSKINENPVGTGPFKFVEWKKDDHITVENFD